MEQDSGLLRHFKHGSKLNKLLIAIVVVSILGGIGTGYVFANKQGGSLVSSTVIQGPPPKSAEEDKRTFRDFAEGTVTAKKATKNGEYTEGTHLLVRPQGVPVALTSSVVDLSQYENKKVKVFGETQKAVKEGWLMDVGRIEIIAP